MIESKMITLKRAATFSVTLALSMTATGAIPIIGDVSASSASGPPDDPDLWGQEARELAQAEGADAGTGNEAGSEMGEHSRESDATTGPGRLGIGNLPGHPSESIQDLCGEGGVNCPDAIAD